MDWAPYISHYNSGLPYWLVLWLLVIIMFSLIVTIVLKSDARSKSAQKKTILIIHADRQHALLMDGDERGGLYGNYPPEEL